MNLEEALQTVHSTVYVRGISNGPLVRSVRLLAPPGHKMVSSVRALHGDMRIRAADVLLSLAKATRPRYRADVYDIHAHWALLRYLGAFERRVGKIDRLGLSLAGRRIYGNQRRVLSEDLGIGLAALLAESWMYDIGAVGSVRMVDIDQLLHDLDRYGIAVGKVANRRPDYLLIADDIRTGGTRYAFLECKGTRTSGYALKQLAAASEQLVGVHVGGHALPGLAVSAVVTENIIEYRAIQRNVPSTRGSSSIMPHIVPPSLDSGLTPYGIEVSEYGSLDPWVSQVGVDQIGPVQPFASAAEAAERLARSDGVAGESSGIVAETVLAKSWEALSDFAGNEEGVERWGSLDREPSRVLSMRPRGEWTSPDGVTVRGVSNSLTLLGGQLESVIGVVRSVDEALMSGDSDAIIRAQHSAAEERSLRHDGDAFENGVAAYGSDGSAMLLLPR